jgi:translation initiation factor 3 subunit D
MQKGKGKGKNKGALAPNQQDEDGFALVDSKPLPGKSFGKGRGLFGRGNKGRGRVRDSNYQEGILGQKQKSQVSSMKGKGKNRGNNSYQQRRSAPSSREWSVMTQSEWEMKREVPLTELGKLQIDAKLVTAEDIVWCGELREYNKDFDKITVRTEKTLKRYEELDFFNPGTLVDPKLAEVAGADEEVSVIATDKVLACLIAAARSQYSWDLVVQTATEPSGRKVMIIDKRDGSPVDFMTVNETATNNQSNDENDKKEINSVKKLCDEATCINQNFSQFVLAGRGESMEESNPFADENSREVASGAIRYRKITIPGNPKDTSEAKQKPIVVAVRTEVNCKLPGSDQYASVKALNEYDPKPNYSWRKLLQSQHGMVMATELKNNAYKLGRWTAEAILAGCDVMKIGYATRTNPNDPWTHSLLSVQTLMTSNFAEQIGMHKNNLYGIIRNIVDLVMEWEDGKYLILKDPMKPIMRIYAVPDDFGDDYEMDEDDMDEDDGPELDEEGNPTPMQAVGPNLA